MKTTTCAALLLAATVLCVPASAADDLFGGTDDSGRIVLNAADAKKVEAPMRFGKDPKLVALAAKKTYLEIPDSGKGGKKFEQGQGSALFEFEVKEDGKYYLFIRAWWPDACGNSLDVTINNGKMKTLTDSTTKNWHWVTLKKKRFKLKKGTNKIQVVNREDGARFDQILFSTDKNCVPQGIEE